MIVACFSTGVKVVFEEMKSFVQSDLPNESSWPSRGYELSLGYSDANVGRDGCIVFHV